MSEEKGQGDSSLNDSTVSEHDPHYDPIISLPEIPITTFEEEEEELIKLRAKLYRYDKSETPAEWKERGTGDAKLLLHKEKQTVRVVMRRDKTLKICANHYVTPWMELVPNSGSDKAWVWSVPADYADEIAKEELLAIRFANAENANKWKEKFEEAKGIVCKSPLYTGKGNFGMILCFTEEEDEDDESTEEDEEKEDAENVTEKLGKLSVQETKEGAKTSENGNSDANKNCDTADAEK